MAEQELDEKSLKKIVLQALGLFIKPSPTETTRNFLKNSGITQEQMEEAWEYSQEEGTKQLSDALIKIALKKRKQGIKDKEISKSFKSIGISDGDIKIILDVASDVQSQEKNVSTAKPQIQEKNTSNQDAKNKHGHNYTSIAITVVFAIALWIFLRR